MHGALPLGADGNPSMSRDVRDADIAKSPIATRFFGSFAGANGTRSPCAHAVESQQPGPAAPFGFSSVTVGYRTLPNTCVTICGEVSHWSESPRRFRIVLSSPSQLRSQL